MSERLKTVIHGKRARDIVSATSKKYPAKAYTLVIEVLTTTQMKRNAAAILNCGGKE